MNGIAPDQARPREATSAPSFSVIIPAHNEENVISRCIESLLADAAPGEIEIVVAANGCTDRTVEIARGFAPAVRVVETAEASKSAALNAGDAAATAFPRVYLDADIAISTATLRETAADMARSGALAGAPRPRLDLRGCSTAVRSFCRVWTAQPWFTQRPLGSGLYILSAAGHARLGRFPDIINDDQYVHDLFSLEERLATEEQSFTLRPPRTVASLVRRRARTMAGQSELDAKFGALKGRAPKMTLLGLLYQRPDLALHVPTFALVTLLAKRAAKANARRGERDWGRDDTSRADVPAARSEGKPTIGRHVEVASSASITNGERISIGDRCQVGEGACLWAGNSTGRITLGDDVIIGQSAILTGSGRGLPDIVSSTLRARREGDIIVRSGALIGPGALVAGGVTIGKGCIVAAGSIVTSDLPANMICEGNPAKPLMPRPKDTEQCQ